MSFIPEGDIETVVRENEGRNELERKYMEQKTRWQKLGLIGLYLTIPGILAIVVYIYRVGVEHGLNRPFERFNEIQAMCDGGEARFMTEKDGQPLWTDNQPVIKCMQKPAPQPVPSSEQQ